MSEKVDNVERIQEGLEKAIRRAGQTDDRELAGQIRETAHRMVLLLNGLMGMSRMYEPTNTALEAPVRDFGAALGSLLDLLGAVHVVCVEDQIYVNDVRLRARTTDQTLIEHLLAELARHDVGGLSIHEPMSPDAIKLLGSALAGPADPQNPRAALAARFAGRANLELAGKYQFRMGGEAASTTRDFGDTLRRGGDVLREAVGNLAANRLPNPLPIRRVVIDLVDAIKKDAGQAALAGLKCREMGSGERHLLTVCNLSLALGRTLGLADGALSDLGVAAMLHDVGYTRSQDLDGHRLAGARLLLRQRGFHEAKVRRLLVVLEHHSPQDPAPGTLFSRIIHVADDYDALTGLHPGKKPISPAVAIAAMWAGRNRIYDARLLALFLQMLGPYPPGTLLELDDGRWVVSLSGSRDRARFGLPLCRVVREANGQPSSNREPQDLALLRDRVKVKRLIDPASSGVDVALAVA